MRLVYAGLLVATLAAVQPLAAGPITYTETGQLSGNVGGVSFTNANFTFVFQGDTANINGVGTSNPVLSNSIVVGAFIGSITSPSLAIGINPTDGVIGYATNTGTIALTSPGAVGYRLATSLSVSNPVGISAGLLATTFGSIQLGSSQNVTFTASVPEPGTLGLMSFAFFGLLVAGVRRSCGR